MQYSKHLLTRILVDWASCKIEAERPEDELVEIVKEKLAPHKDISFTKIAQKAINLEKRTLALKLLDLEQDIKKKIPILLGLEKYHKAIHDSVNNFLN